MTRPGSSKLGLWLVGASGNVATAVAVGLAAIRRGLTGRTGLVTELPELAGLDLAPLERVVLGGHEIAARTPSETARQLARADGLFSERLLEEVASEVEGYAARVRRGEPGGAGGPGRLQRLARDLAEFSADAAVERVVVVNVASTESPVVGPLPDDPDELRSAIEGGVDVPASVLYAFAALDAGFAYVNFTPSTGSHLPALDRLARARGAAHAGRDGKTGETLLKSALAPMFARRNLRVLSWFGQNILGNRDGATLADPATRVSKTRAKSAIVPAVLGYEPASHVGIHYMEPLGDWKLAWDHILFEGFLGTRMSLQLTWEGADSALAAPLILDLGRLVDLAVRRGEAGALGHLAFFFKDPLGSAEHALDAQWQMLLGHLRRQAGP